MLHISIHVPLAGNDPSGICGRLKNRNFNPRSPCGERHVRRSVLRIRLRISIHVPLAGNDAANRSSGGGSGISIHVPLAGNDRLMSGRSRSSSRFQSTFPLRGTTCPAPSACPARTFQSTFPLRGTTDKMYRQAKEHPVFQSTFPLRGTTTA